PPKASTRGKGRGIASSRSARSAATRSCRNAAFRKVARARRLRWRTSRGSNGPTWGSLMGSSYRAAGAFRKRGVISRLSDVIWPPRSLLSETIVDRPGVIEAELWGELKFLSDPQCACCGFPLPEGGSPGDICGACAGRKPAYDTARAALAYEDHARRLILDLKRGGRRDGLPVFAKWMSA